MTETKMVCFLMFLVLQFTKESPCGNKKNHFILVFRTGNIYLTEAGVSF